MAVPRNRHSNARKNSRQAHDALNPKQLTVCSNCGGHKLPHFVCSSCGTYGGQQVLSKAEEGTTASEG